MIVLNLLPVKSGGGLQNAVSFIRCCAESGRKVEVVCNSSATAIRDECLRSSVPYMEVDNRAAFEVFKARKQLGASRVCLTLFGPPIYSTCGSWLNVSGVAYSNLFFPEIDFWGYLGGVRKSWKLLVDRGRKSGLSWSDYWIFETELLADVAPRFGFPSDRIGHVPMTVSEVVGQSERFCRGEASPCDGQRNPFRILYLASPHPNKRHHLLLEVAVSLVNKGFDNFKFVTTVHESVSYGRRFLKSVQASGLARYFENLGTIGPTDVASVIRRSDAMCLFSVLESFSNNVVEAWACRRPLVITDAEWSRSACGSAAVYVDPVKANATADSIIQLATNADDYDRIVIAGESALSSLPCAQTRTRMFFDEIDKAVQLGKASAESRKRIFR